MKYDLKTVHGEFSARRRFSDLIEKGAKIELKKIHPKRSTSQNAYLHVLMQLWANEFGYTIDEAKNTVKKALRYTYFKEQVHLGTNQKIEYVKKTSGMDSKELTIFIEKFRNWSADTCGLYLPSSEEYITEQIYFDNEVERQ